MDNKLENFIKNKECFYIHYASDGFYSGSSPAPRISCIIIWNDNTKERYKFDIQDYTTDNSLKQAERENLCHFKTFFEKRPNACFIHWNMKADGFGFKAIQARAHDLGINMPIPDDDKLFDLSSYIGYLAGKKLSIKQILWFNSLLTNEYLDGKVEAEYFKKWKFEEISNSVSLKVTAFSVIVEDIKNGTLRIEPEYLEDRVYLTKEERHAEALKRSQMREQMLQDIMEYNKKVMAHNERIMEEAEAECDEEGIFYYDSEHPILSLFASWFACQK